jgi:hypothetical protein
MLGVRFSTNIGASTVPMIQRAWGLGEDAADDRSVSTMNTKMRIFGLSGCMERLPLIP